MIKNDTNTTTLNGILQDIYYLSKTNVSTFVVGDLYRILNKYYKQTQQDIAPVLGAAQRER